MRSNQEIWYSRNPQHEVNLSTGKDMFMETAMMCMDEYADERCIELLDWLWEVCNDEETWKLIGYNSKQILEKFKQLNKKT